MAQNQRIGMVWFGKHLKDNPFPDGAVGRDTTARLSGVVKCHWAGPKSFSPFWILQAGRKTAPGWFPPAVWWTCQRQQHSLCWSHCVCTLGDGAVVTAACCLMTLQITKHVTQLTTALIPPLRFISPVKASANEAVPTWQILPLIFFKS